MSIHVNLVTFMSQFKRKLRFFKQIFDGTVTRF